jgi:MoxR-like ATPase
LPFIVLATQNPIEYEGTFPLPEAQLDRFMMRVQLGYPSPQDEMRILEQQKLQHPIDTLKSVFSADEVLAAAEAVKAIFVSDAIRRYIVEIIARTRQNADIYLGASPRGSLALYRAGQALAGLAGREFVLPDDIKFLADPVLGHRIIVTPAARLRELSEDRIIQEIIEKVPVPGGDFRSHVE